MSDSDKGSCQCLDQVVNILVPQANVAHNINVQISGASLKTLRQMFRTIESSFIVLPSWVIKGCLKKHSKMISSNKSQWVACYISNDLSSNLKKWNSQSLPSMENSLKLNLIGHALNVQKIHILYLFQELRNSRRGVINVSIAQIVKRRLLACGSEAKIDQMKLSSTNCQSVGNLGKLLGHCFKEGQLC